MAQGKTFRKQAELVHIQTETQTGITTIVCVCPGLSFPKHWKDQVNLGRQSERERRREFNVIPFINKFCAAIILGKSRAEFLTRQHGLCECSGFWGVQFQCSHVPIELWYNIAGTKQAHFGYVFWLSLSFWTRLSIHLCPISLSRCFQGVTAYLVFLCLITLFIVKARDNYR